MLREGLQTMRDMIEIIAETYGIRKCRAISRKGFAASQNMLAHLGFVRLRRSRQRYYIYVREF